MSAIEDYVVFNSTTVEEIKHTINIFQQIVFPEKSPDTTICFKGTIFGKPDYDYILRTSHNATVLDIQVIPLGHLYYDFGICMKRDPLDVCVYHNSQ
jgi:hypothetical protein